MHYSNNKKTYIKTHKKIESFSKRTNGETYYYIEG